MGDLEGLYLGDFTQVHRSGIGDAGLHLAVNLLGAPAMTLEEFPSFKARTLVGVSLSVWAPTGKYDPSKAINIGTNRWSLKSEVGVVRVVGRWAFDVYLGGRFFTTNPDFLDGSRREQDPILSTEPTSVEPSARGGGQPWTQITGGAVKPPSTASSAMTSKATRASGSPWRLESAGTTACVLPTAEARTLASAATLTRWVSPMDSAGPDTGRRRSDRPRAEMSIDRRHPSQSRIVGGQIFPMQQCEGWHLCIRETLEGRRHCPGSAS